MGKANCSEPFFIRSSSDDEGFGPYHKDSGEEVADVPHEGREQPTIEGPKERTLDLPSQHDDLLAQQ